MCSHVRTVCLCFYAVLLAVSWSKNQTTTIRYSQVVFVTWNNIAFIGFRTTLKIITRVHIIFRLQAVSRSHHPQVVTKKTKMVTAKAKIHHRRQAMSCRPSFLRCFVIPFANIVRENWFIRLSVIDLHKLCACTGFVVIQYVIWNCSCRRSSNTASELKTRTESLAVFPRQILR